VGLGVLVEVTETAELPGAVRAGVWIGGVAVRLEGRVH
jgi:hypothetical protein